MADFTAVALRRIWGTESIVFWTERFAYNSSGDVEYHGIAARGTAASASAWLVERFTYNSDGNVTLIDTAVVDSVWNDRATLTYA